MRAFLAIVRRELAAYFTTPIAYVFIVIFVALAGVFTFQVGNYFARGLADLQPFFLYLPWLMLVLAPAVSMRLWAEERRSGTIELLLTLPVTTTQAVLGKWVAGWLFLGVALMATFGLWITVNWLGAPDNRVIALSYLAGWITGGVLLAAGAAMSAFTRNQVIAFVLAAAVSFLLMSTGTPLVQDALGAALPGPVAEALMSISVLAHFSPAVQGMVRLADVLYWVTMTAFWLFVNVLVVEWRKAA